MPSLLLAAALCLVVGIQDGDTLTARCSDAGDDITVKVRLAEIDAPEKRQPWGMQSKQGLSALCFGQQAASRSRPLRTHNWTCHLPRKRYQLISGHARLRLGIPKVPD